MGLGSPLLCSCLKMGLPVRHVLPPLKDEHAGPSLQAASVLGWGAAAYSESNAPFSDRGAHPCLGSRAVPKRVGCCFFALGTALRFWGRLQPNCHRLEANRRQLEANRRRLEANRRQL